jgi:methionyl-tRNA formyltransferase|tara:strand:- start:1300 stop:2070 length:771 start_codon:yes stop_codon:yes gene_type:complete
MLQNKSLKIGIFASNVVGYKLLKYIIKKKTKIEYVVTYDDLYENDIIKLCETNDIQVEKRLDINSEKFVNLNKEKSIDLVFMLWFPTIVKSESLKSVKKGFINLHPSYLPYNRGMHPYYWSIVDGNQAGTSIHFIDENIDEGKVLFQKKIDFDITDTGDSLYEKNMEETITLFKDSFQRILDGNYIETSVDNTKGSFHYSKELFKHSKIELDKKYKAIDLINIIRARTFGESGGSYFYLDGKKYKVRLNVEENKDE